jgi:nitronate monooxygenase
MTSMSDPAEPTWPRSDLIDLLGISHPIIQAPMASASNPAMVAAVANVGGLGSLGCAMFDTVRLREAAKEIRQLTDRPYNLNFFVHQDPDLETADPEPMRALLAPYYAERGIDSAPNLSLPFTTFDDETLETLLEIRPPVVSFHFGLPKPEAMTALKDAGVTILSSATTVPEALALADGGVDAIVAQGHEAGGHRGTFAEPFEDGLVGTMALVPQIVDAVDVPVIAAGGIADGRGIAAAFALGASGAQIGTAYLTCPESPADEVYRAALRQGTGDQTRITRIFTGRPARSLRNRMIDEMSDHEKDVAPFPSQTSLTAPLRKATERDNAGEMRSLWSGQAVALNRELPAAELTTTLVDEARACLRNNTPPPNDNG